MQRSIVAPCRVDRGFAEEVVYGDASSYAAVHACRSRSAGAQGLAGRSVCRSLRRALYACVATVGLLTRAPESRESPDDLSNRAERRIIGTIGLGLPLLLYLVAAWRPQDPSVRRGLCAAIG